MRYPHILAAIRSARWAVQPATLQAIRDVLSSRLMLERPASRDRTFDHSAPSFLSRPGARSGVWHVRLGVRVRITARFDTERHAMNTNTESKLVDSKGLLAALFSEDSRPSERWLRKQVAGRAIPFVRIGRMVRFDPGAVRESLAKNFTVHAR